MYLSAFLFSIRCQQSGLIDINNVCRWMKKIQAAIMTSVASILAVGAVILEDIRFRRLLRREPHVNREYETEIYMNSILYVKT
jgi:hypothetical protein